VLAAGDEVDDPHVGAVRDEAGGIIVAGDDLVVNLDDDVGEGVAEPFQEGGDGQVLLPFDFVAVVDQDHDTRFYPTPSGCASQCAPLMCFSQALSL